MSDASLFGAEITLQALEEFLISVYTDRGLRSRRAVFLHGPPGIGKTAITRQVADAVGGRYLRHNFVTTDYMQMCGLPDREEGRRRGLERAVRVPLIEIPSEGEGLFVLDDFTHSMRDIQNVALDLTVERRINDSKLGDSWLLVFCGNDTGGVFQLAAGLANRFMHFYVRADLLSFKNWGITKGNIRPEIMSFLEAEPDMLSVVPQKQEMAYPTPRSWDRLSQDMDELVADRGQPLGPLMSKLRLLSGAEVGSAATARFVAHLGTYGLIDFPAVLSGRAPSLREQAAAAGTEPDKLSAVVQAMAYSLCAHIRSWWTTSKDTAADRARALGLMLPYLEPAYATMVVRDLAHLDHSWAMRVLHAAQAQPGLKHVLDIFASLGRLQAGAGLDGPVGEVDG